MLSARSGRGIRVVAVTARSKAKKRSVNLRGIDWAKSPLALATDPAVDCFVELMGGAGDPALSAVEAALKAGKSVVTANKALIAKHGVRLAKAAEKHGGAFNYEAAVGAAIPVIKTLREGLAGTGVSRVYGILNGTCNYILTTMQDEGRPFAEVLKEAQDRGYAEADPSFDVGVTGQVKRAFGPVDAAQVERPLFRFRARGDGDDAYATPAALGKRARLLFDEADDFGANSAEPRNTHFQGCDHG